MKSNYIACHMLWAVLSSFHYLFDEGIDLKAKASTQTWSSLREKAAGWLIDEANRVVRNANWSHTVEKKMNNLLDEEGDRLVFFAVARVKSASSLIVTRTFSQDEMSLYFYMCWLNLVLHDLTQIGEGESVQPNRFTSADLLLELRRLVKIEINNIEQLGIVEINETALQVSRELFDYWKSQTMALVEA